MLSNIILALPLMGAVSALPARLAVREVPQEHAHENVLTVVDAGLQSNNPGNFGASVFGLLGKAAAASGAGNLADADCLQQAIADQVFTNGKAAGDVNTMTFALIYRALERNTGAVGQASVPCASVKAVNPEIAALQQHQDPASNGAAALNKQIATELAKQIASIGGDPTLANEASTFAPGKLGDPTAKGLTCDDANDKAGCINTLKLRVDDLSADEITAAVSGVSAGAANAGNATAAAGGAAAQACAAPSAAAAAAPAAAPAATSAPSSTAAAPAATGAASNKAAFGSCDPSIVFTQTPADGRQEAAFQAKDLSTFPHGSALGAKVITDFICQQAVNKCKIDAATEATCNAASTAASQLKGQAAADSFNAAIGF
ncbi:hypothetical protein K504DRAFT_499936 [Pleomassaria siparia CBS 279.74]|uniref:Cell wall protein n=1 Tax=Pleomassaria siparia CBS 279.74 TaxID=1314801 RepID=A0A6G1KEJ2_9PLEO|nr:hypothetical protein K504DRAFT_499936 [Pleomassaria siparia CBS 279.74]